jgi:hypothetical protein
MKKNLPNAATILISLILLVGGCGMLGKNEVSKEQINADLSAMDSKTADERNGWYFSDREDLRCFSIADSKYNGDRAELSLMVVTSAPNPFKDTEVMISSGKIDLVYKKDKSGKWSLGKFVGGERKLSIIPKEDAEVGGKWFEIVKPICSAYIDTPSVKK